MEWGRGRGDRATRGALTDLALRSAQGETEGPSRKSSPGLECLPTINNTKAPVKEMEATFTALWDQCERCVTFRCDLHVK